MNTVQKMSVGLGRKVDLAKKSQNEFLFFYDFYGLGKSNRTLFPALRTFDRV